MPNGFYGSAEEWERMEAPFREVDEQLEEFAEAHGMSVVKNYHNWPGRRLDWGDLKRRWGTCCSEWHLVPPPSILLNRMLPFASPGGLCIN